MIGPLVVPHQKPSSAVLCSHLGRFPLTRHEHECVLALASDPANQHLVAGDTAGYINVFDISNYCTTAAPEHVMYTCNVHVMYM